ncbi:MAG: galactokinase family protein [Streptococcus sp.]
MKTSQLREKFKEVFGVEADHTFFSPGRINLIGEHTDYNGGHVFPAAITLGTYGAARKRDDKVLRFFSGNFEDKGIIEVPLENLRFEKNTTGQTIQKVFFISCKRLVIRLIQAWIFTSMVTFQTDQVCHHHHLWNC